MAGYHRHRFVPHGSLDLVHGLELDDRDDESTYSCCVFLPPSYAVVTLSLVKFYKKISEARLRRPFLCMISSRFPEFGEVGLP